MKRSYIVVGPESSGTRMMTNLLIQAGCAGSDGFSQEFDYGIPDNVDLLVWRRSVPHIGEYPDLFQMCMKLEEKDFTTQIIVTNREWYPMMRSQIKNNHVNTKSEAYENIMKSHYHIFNDIQSCMDSSTLDPDHPFISVYYESLVSNTEAVLSKIMPLLHLEPLQDVELYNGNKKWYTTEMSKIKTTNGMKGAATVKPSFGIVLEGSN